MIFLYKIKPNKREAWIEWCEEIMSRQNEAIETLKEEQLIREGCFIFGEGDNSFAVFYNDPEKGKEKLKANMDRQMNQKHFRMMDECLEPYKPRVVGYNIEVL